MGEQARHFEDIDDVKHDYSPSVHIQVERDLHDKIILGTDLLVKIARRNANAARPISQMQIDVKAERQARNWRLRLQVQVSSSESQRARFGERVRHLDVVVGGDAALNAHDLATNFWRLGLHNIALLLVGLPICKR